MPFLYSPMQRAKRSPRASKSTGWAAELQAMARQRHFNMLGFTGIYQYMLGKSDVFRLIGFQA